MSEITKRPTEADLLAARDAALDCIRWTVPLSILQCQHVLCEQGHSPKDPHNQEMKRCFVECFEAARRLRDALTDEILTAVEVARAARPETADHRPDGAGIQSAHNAVKWKIWEVLALVLPHCPEPMRIPDWVPEWFDVPAPKDPSPGSRYYCELAKRLKDHDLAPLAGMEAAVRSEYAATLAYLRSLPPKANSPNGKKNHNPNPDTTQSRKIQTRRQQAKLLSEQGLNNKQISLKLNVSEATVSRDLATDLS